MWGSGSTIGCRWTRWRGPAAARAVGVSSLAPPGWAARRSAAFAPAALMGRITLTEGSSISQCETMRFCRPLVQAPSGCGRPQSDNGHPGRLCEGKGGSIDGTAPAVPVRTVPVSRKSGFISFILAQRVDQFPPVCAFLVRKLGKTPPPGFPIRLGENRDRARTIQRVADAKGLVVATALGGTPACRGRWTVRAPCSTSVTPRRTDRRHAFAREWLRRSPGRRREPRRDSSDRPA